MLVQNSECYFELGIEQSQFLIEHQVEGSRILTGGKFGFEGSIILTILLIIVITGMHLVFRRKAEIPLPVESADSTPSGKLE